MPQGRAGTKVVPRTGCPSFGLGPKGGHFLERILMENNLPKNYDPRSFEDRIYKEWEESGAFKPRGDRNGKGHFSIVMPPPNITGQLHMGHALDQSLQDVLTRFKRM